MFIGNGPLSPTGGNTQVLTEIIPPSLLKYTYESNTNVKAITGFDPSGDPYISDANYPTIRTYQEKFDDFVNVKDYGAIGDGIADDGPAISRAIKDIARELLPTDNRQFRTLYIPAGTYNISKTIKLFPSIKLVGEGQERTIIALKTSAGLTGDDECVIRTVDSLEQAGSNIDGSANQEPGLNHLVGISFISETPQGVASDSNDIIKLDHASNCWFDDCAFKGTWDVSLVTGTSRSIHFDKPGISTDDMGRFTFVNCTFEGTAFAFQPLIDLKNVLVATSTFNQHQTAIQLGDGSGQTIELFRVTHSTFGKTPNPVNTIVNESFLIDTDGKGNVSSNNYYADNLAATRSIRFASGTTACMSIGDVFDVTTDTTCINGLIDGPRIQDQDGSNIIMNAQDPFRIPNGFCGDITIDGDLTVTGEIVAGSTSTTVNAGTSITVLPINSYDGETIIMEYAMHVPTENVYRNGTFQIIHNGTGNPAGIAYSDEYTELNGTPSQPIVLQAEYDVSGDFIHVSIEDLAGAALLPSFNFLTRRILI